MRIFKEVIRTFDSYIRTSLVIPRIFDNHIRTSWIIPRIFASGLK